MAQFYFDLKFSIIPFATLKMDRNYVSVKTAVQIKSP